MGETQRLTLQRDLLQRVRWPGPRRRCALELPPSSVVSGAAQAFERGWMLWFADRGQILVLTTTAAARMFTDTFREGMPDPADARRSPPGLLTPVRGFRRLRAGRGCRAQASGLGWARALEMGISIFRQPAGRSSCTTDLSLARPARRPAHAGAERSAGPARRWLPAGSSRQQRPRASAPLTRRCCPRKWSAAHTRRRTTTPADGATCSGGTLK
jgi:hypothetical protein